MHPFPSGRSGAEAPAPSFQASLQELGAHLRLLRESLRESREIFALRLAVSPATLKKMESGDTGVAIGAWFAVFHLAGIGEALLRLMQASPAHARRLGRIDEARIVRLTGQLEKRLQAHPTPLPVSAQRCRS